MRPRRVANDGDTINNTLNQHCHCWKNGERTGLLEPVWPREPDMEVARTLAIAQLPPDQFSDTKIAPFSQSLIFERLANVNIGINGNYVIGRIVSTRFFREKRLLLPTASRGPFRTSGDLVRAETTIVGQRISHLSPDPKDEYYCESDEELVAAGPDLHKIFETFQAHITARTPDSIFPRSPLSQTMPVPPEDTAILWHDDLSMLNILVDPSSYRLAGVIDWESVSIVPAWEAIPRPPDSTTYTLVTDPEVGTTTDPKPDPAPDTAAISIPYFLHAIQVLEPPPRESVADEEEHYYVEIRKDWEKLLLQRRYCEIVPPVFDMESAGGEEGHEKPGGDESASERRRARMRMIKVKKNVVEALGNFEENWRSVRYSLENVFFDVDGDGNGGEEEEDSSGDGKGSSSGGDDGNDEEDEGSDDDGQKGGVKLEGRDIKRCLDEKMSEASPEETGNTEGEPTHVSR